MGDGGAAVSELIKDVGVGVDSIGGEERAVLDRVGSGSHRVSDALRPVSVRGELQTVGVCLVDRGGELGTRVLRLVRSEGGCHVAAGGHDLDDIDAAGHPVPHCLADAVDAVGLAAEEPAVPARDGEGRAGGNDARPDLLTVPEPVPQRE
jgi:hypothetical protein